MRVCCRLDRNPASLSQDTSFSSGSELEEAAADVTDQGALTKLHGHVTGVRLPFVRLLRNNVMGLTCHFFFGAWVGGSGEPLRLGSWAHS